MIFEMRNTKKLKRTTYLNRKITTRSLPRRGAILSQHNKNGANVEKQV